jgi:hypothetical protein
MLLTMCQFFKLGKLINFMISIQYLKIKDFSEDKTTQPPSRHETKEKQLVGSGQLAVGQLAVGK